MHAHAAKVNLPTPYEKPSAYSMMTAMAKDIEEAVVRVLHSSLRRNISRSHSDETLGRCAADLRRVARYRCKAFYDLESSLLVQQR